MKTIFAATLLTLSSLPALPAIAADGRLSEAGACRNPAILGFITRNFDHKAANYLKRQIAIAEIRDMRQSRLQLRDDTHRVEREYCRATALTTDGRRRPLWYLIERDWAFAGLGSSVEYCLSGLDPRYVHGAQCASLR